MTNYLKRQYTSQRQKGAATLITVMVLFLIMALMAAYANRNLLAEERIAYNVQLTGVAAEASDGGTEWTLSMLNSGYIDNNCQPSAKSRITFRNKYININPGNRIIDRLSSSALVGGCHHLDDKGWECTCPPNQQYKSWATNETAVLQPDFTIGIVTSAVPSAIDISSISCTSSSDIMCINDVQGLDVALGRTLTKITATLVSALKMPPATPLTMAGSITMDAVGLGLHNGDPRSAGMLLQTGGPNPTGWVPSRLESTPGTPFAQAMLTADSTLASKTAPQLFARFFGMSAARYKNQPAARIITCSSDCMTELAAVYNKGMRIAWIDAATTLASNTILGSAVDPMVIIVNGDLSITGPMQINGLIYVRGNTTWFNGSGQPSLINGALIGEGTLNTSGLIDVAYQASIMDILSNTVGSFVRVPSSYIY